MTASVFSNATAFNDPSSTGGSASWRSPRIVGERTRLLLGFHQTGGTELCAGRFCLERNTPGWPWEQPVRSILVLFLLFLEALSSHSHPIK